MTAVLVVRPSSLGDIVHALALVDDVLRSHPAASIDWVAEEAFVELPALSQGIDRVVPIALRRWRRAPWSPTTWRELAAFRSLLREKRYDVVLDLQEQLKGAIVSRLARGVSHGFDRESIREPVAAWLDDVHHRVPRAMHFSQRCRALAAGALGYAVQGPPRWRLSPRPVAPAMPAGRYAVALHATSREGKLWPEERWRALVKAFADAGLDTVLPWGSEDERARSDRIAAGIGGASVPPRQSLGELAALVARADIVVGVDTGLTHLAAALGTPVVALFTETDPAGAGVAFAGPHARDLGGNGRVPAVDDVRAAVGTLMRSAPRC